MGYNLTLHNVGFISGAIIALAFALFVYLKDKNSKPNIMFGLAFLGIVLFCGSHVIGVNIKDPYLSRNVLMWNLSVIWIACFLTHCSFAMIGAVKKQRIFMTIMYALAFILTTFYILQPNAFLLPSVPKMYFPNYYVAGNLQWIMRIFFSIGVPIYFLSYLFYSYNHADIIMRNRLKYFFLSLTLGYSIGSLAIPLVYNIAIDPIYASVAVPVLAIPMAYALVRYNLMDIRLITKRALLFATIVAISSFGIFSVGYINFTLISKFSDFPGWILPIIASCIATGLGIIVWYKFRESDILKYEFITIVTHKLRTPLTAIKWSAENLTSFVSTEGQKDLNNIKSGTERLVELSNIIANVSSEDQEQYAYHYTTTDLVEMCTSIIKEHKDQAKSKNINLLIKKIPSTPTYIQADKIKLRICFQTLIDNALTYTPQNGLVSLDINKNGNMVLISINDTGIGLSKEELRMIFSRLYRTDTARNISTEGMGVGLFVAKKIIERHNGRIYARSDGKNTGSTFIISLPVLKS